MPIDVQLTHLQVLEKHVLPFRHPVFQVSHISAGQRYQWLQHDFVVKLSRCWTGWSAVECFLLFVQQYGTIFLSQDSSTLCKIPKPNKIHIHQCYCWLWLSKMVWSLKVCHSSLCWETQAKEQTNNKSKFTQITFHSCMTIKHYTVPPLSITVHTINVIGYVYTAN